MENKTIAVLGATGSVGTQALGVARLRGYSVDLLTAAVASRELEALAREFNPRFVALSDERAACELKIALADTDITVLSGASGILRGIEECGADAIVNSITGAAGLLPTLAVIEKGARLCLANKESLVMAGEAVMERARHNGVEIIPVDSEHSAIFQSLRGGGEIKKIYLTASGGPFRGKSKAELSCVTVEDTLRHPTWKMGKRITVDSATLMNKGFEIIEAVHLFGVAPEKIEVLIHPESILHSAVEYLDNAIIGQLSVPDMSLPIQYAIDYPERISQAVEPLSLAALGSLTFASPDTEAFPAIPLAYRAAREGGAMGAVLNAADEVAVGEFLSDRLSFLGIYDTVEKTYERLLYNRGVSDIDGILAADAEARIIAREIIRGK